MDYVDPFGFGEKQIVKMEEEEVKMEKYNRGMYRVHLTIFEQGITHHRFIRTNVLEQLIHTDLGNYQLIPNVLFKEDGSRIDRLRGIRQRFQIFYDKDTSSPKQIDLTPPFITASHIHIIETSNSLRTMIDNWFKEQFDSKKLLIIFVAVGMVAVFLLNYLGYIDLGGMLK